MTTKERWNEVQNFAVNADYKLSLVLICVSIISLMLAISNITININILVTSWGVWLITGIIITIIDYIVIENINGR